MSDIVDDKYDKPNQTKRVLPGSKKSFTQLSHRYFNKRIYMTGFIAFLCLKTIDYIWTDILKMENNTNETMVREAVKESIVMTIYGCLIGPILEELVFRKFIFGKIKKHSKMAAYIISSFLFAIVHFLADIKEMFNEIASFPIYFIFGLILAFTYDYGSSLLASIIGHVSMNSSNLLFFYKML